MTMQNLKAKILVTGATGQSGSMVIREFIRQEIPVRVLVRDREKARKFEGYPYIEIVEGNMLQPDTLQAAFEGVEKTLLISTAFEKMLETQLSFIDAAKTAGIPHVIKFSGAEAGIGFNTCNFKPGVDHGKIEDHLIDSGLQWTILRPSQFMQLYLPGAHSGVNLKKNALILPLGNSMNTPVAIEDIAKVCVKLLTQPGHEGRFYEMTGPDAMTMHDVCTIITEVTGRKITYWQIDIEEHQANYLKAGMPPAVVQMLIAQVKEKIKCRESYVKLDTHKRLGIRPTGFAEFIYRHSATFAAAPHP